MIGLLLFVYTVMGSIPTVHVTFNYVSWFCVLFLLASFFRKYPPKWAENQRICISLLVLSLIASSCSILLGSWFTSRMGTIVVFSLLQDSHKILALTNAITSFLVFRNMCIGYCPTINWVASSVFGIFLFHTASDAMRQFLWQDVARCQAWFNSIWIPVHAFVVILSVFLVGLLIDKCRAIVFSCLCRWHHKIPTTD